MLGICWLGMQASHELGHITAAVTTGGSVTNVVVHPLAVSRTDVSPNPHPLIVAWAGPCLGTLVPLIIAPLIRPPFCRTLADFFAGFCLIANGAYVAIGSFDGIGDCETMLTHGSPLWLLVAFGTALVLLGFTIWHQLGSITKLFQRPSFVSCRTAVGFAGTLVMISVVLAMISGR